MDTAIDVPTGKVSLCSKLTYFRVKRLLVLGLAKLREIRRNTYIQLISNGFATGEEFHLEMIATPIHTDRGACRRQAETSERIRKRLNMERRMRLRQSELIRAAGYSIVWTDRPFLRNVCMNQMYQQTAKVPTSGIFSFEKLAQQRIVVGSHCVDREGPRDSRCFVVLTGLRGNKR
jgi:hypothetical protein